jgi:hypothetical protein
MYHYITLTHEIPNIYSDVAELLTVELECRYKIELDEHDRTYITGVNILSTSNFLFCVEWAQVWIDGSSKSALEALSCIDSQAFEDFDDY